MDAKANNITVEQEGTKLIITIDTKRNIGVSKSGKNILVASTKGNQVLANGITLGLNAYKEKTSK